MTDVRAVLLRSAAQQDPEFPDGESKELLRFAYVGAVVTPAGLVHVVDRFEVLGGMLAPRGLPRLDFYDQEYRLLASHWWPTGHPLWCEGSRLYLDDVAAQGFPVDPKIRGMFEVDELAVGNVIEFRDGFDRAYLTLERRYGSSGGTESGRYRHLEQMVAGAEPRSEVRGLSPRPGATDLRTRLLRAASEQDPDFPDGESELLVRFMQIGALETPDGPVHVVERLSVATGMVDPDRTVRLDFYDGSYGLLASHPWPWAPPLWCEGSRLYLHGRAPAKTFPVDPELLGRFPPGTTPYGNVLECRDGFDRAFLTLARRYGVSGGIDDDPFRRLRPAPSADPKPR